MRKFLYKSHYFLSTLFIGILRLAYRNLFHLEPIYPKNFFVTHILLVLLKLNRCVFLPIYVFFQKMTS